MSGLTAGALAVIIIVLPPDAPGGARPAEPDAAAAATVASTPSAAPPGGAEPAPGPTNPGGLSGSGAPAGGGRDGLLGGMLGMVNLAGWKLTLPVPSDKGTAASVNPTDDAAAPWLVRGRDGSITLWAPVAGATTTNSKHARTELVSLTTFPAGSSPHTLRASVAVTQLPKQKPDIILGQIHGAEDLKSVPFVMLHYDAGAIRVVVKQEQSGSAARQYPLISGVPLGARFDFSISDTGDGNLRFTATYGATSRTATAPIPSAFRGATVRFQAGDYQQAESSGGAAPSGALGGDGARVTFYALTETHGQGPAAS